MRAWKLDAGGRQADRADTWAAGQACCDAGGHDSRVLGERWGPCLLHTVPSIGEG